MTDPALIERITRSLAFMLRHQPETFDLELDPHGYADIDDVVHALNERLGEPVEEEDVREAVTSGDRPRYEIQGERIRALYGHSIPVEPGPSSKPPEFLFVAVPEQELERARRFGLRGGRRRFLHLALTKDDAAESGRRTSRDYTVLMIHALDAWEEGISFYDRVALWLAEEVPTNLIEVEGSYHDGTDPEPRRFEGAREHGGHERERGHDRHGRGRGRGGRGRDRGRGGFERGGHEPRSEPATSARSEPYGAAGGESGSGGRFERGDGRGGRGEPGERLAHGARESAPTRDQPSFSHPERAEGSRPDGRRGGHGAERPANERSHYDRPQQDRPHQDRPHQDRPHQDRPQHDRPHESREQRPERREFARDGRRDEGHEPRRERPAPERSSAPVSRGPAAPTGSFGAGIEAEEERRRERAATPPTPSRPPQRKEPPPPVKNDGPGFGAGL